VGGSLSPTLLVVTRRKATEEFRAESEKWAETVRAEVETRPPLFGVNYKTPPMGMSGWEVMATWLQLAIQDFPRFVI